MERWQLVIDSWQHRIGTVSCIVMAPLATWSQSHSDLCQVSMAMWKLKPATVVPLILGHCSLPFL